MQILCWMFNGEHGKQRFNNKSTLWVGLSADDLADAYHGVPNIPTQVNLCIAAIRNPHTGIIEFYMSRTHFFGLAAAAVNFKRLPEIMTAVCRRVGMAPLWHFFDDQGTLDFETCTPGEDEVGSGMSASEFVGFVYKRLDAHSNLSNTCLRQASKLTWDCRICSIISTAIKFLSHRRMGTCRKSMIVSKN